MDTRFADNIVWHDGQFLPWQRATAHLMTYSFHTGVSVFEGIRAYQTQQGAAIFRLNCHLERLLQSAALLKMKVDYSVAELLKITQQVIQQSKLTNAYIRPLLYYDGAGYVGIKKIPQLTVKLMIAAVPWQQQAFIEQQAKGIKTAISMHSKPPTASYYPHAKASANYLNAIMAVQNAHEQGYDDVIQLDHNGFVAEASGANLFMVKGDEILTPHCHACLPGITRDTVITFLKNNGYQITVRDIVKDELFTADEVFLTGTATEIMPIVSVNHYSINNGTVGKITHLLQNAYQTIVNGQDGHYHHWITYVKGDYHGYHHENSGQTVSTGGGD